MILKETTVFTKQVQRLLDRESYRLLQLRLVAEPDAGDLTPKQKAVLKKLIQEEYP